MKNEIKILIAAIVVILIILVGAFALSGSSPQPSATPTAVPVTVTPTPVPVNGGSTGNGTASATPAPTVAPTATPSPSPTPSPSSGVKQTEFGYWITYPPLDPQKWSTNPPPNVGPSNVVFFDPTSATMALNSDNKGKTSGWDGDYQEATIYRAGGNMSETVLVTIHMTTSSNIAWGTYDAATPASYNYRASMHGEGDENFVDLGNGDYELTFGPDVTEHSVCIHVDPYYTPSPNPNSLEALKLTMAEGWVKLTITGADGGYGVLQDQKDFTLSVKNLPYVYYIADSDGYTEGYISWDTGQITNTTQFGSVDNSSGDKFYVTLPVYRDTTVGTLNVNFDWDYDVGTITPAQVTINPFTFADGASQGFVTVGIDKSLIMGGVSNELYIDIKDGDNYFPGYDDEFTIYLNN